MKNIAKEYLPFVLAVFCLFAARSSLADHYVVPSGSMERTLVPGDRVAVDKRAYGVRVPFSLHKLTAGAPPARGDVVIFDSPADGTRLIKRVVAVGGDILEVRNGYVFINGDAAADAGDVTQETFGPRAALLELRFGGGPTVAPMSIPQGYAFVLGDARGNSRDSRFFGLVRTDVIYAQALAVYFRGGEGFTWKPL